MINLWVTQTAIIAKFMSNPYRWKEHRRLELYNETMILLFSYHLIVFTDFVPDPSVRSMFGESQILFSFILIWTNIMILVIQFFRNARRTHKKHK